MTGADGRPPGSSDGGLLSRRGYLFAAGGAAGIVGAGAIGASDSVSVPPIDEKPRPGSDHPTFLWMHAHFWLRPRIRRNLFAFARRHDMVVVLSQPGPTRRPDAAVEEFIEGPLAEASELSVPVWLATGVLNSMTAPEFVSDPEKREHHLDGLRTLTEEYDERFPDGRVVLWQEAPISGHWSSEGQVWDEESIRNLQRYGPTIFEEQRRVVKGVNDDIGVGIFPHFTYVVDSKDPEVFEGLVDDLRTRGAFPDFGFVDFYRGNYEPGVGPTGADDAIRSLIGNARTHLDGRDVCYLGQAHTNKTGYTPSKQALRMDLRAARDAGAASIGYYAWFVYQPTDPARSFDPFIPIPEMGDDLRDRMDVTTYTIGRDRFLYAYSLLLGHEEGYGADGTFDLWLGGSDLDFHDHRLWLETVDGDWEFVGDFNGYVRTDHLYERTRDDHVSVFHALDRERYLAADDGSGAAGADDGGTLTLRIDTRADASAAELRSVSAVPFDPDSYVSEPEAMGLLDDGDAAAFTLGHESMEERLTPGGSSTVRLEVAPSGRTRSLNAVRYPDERETLRRLEALETAGGFDPESVFDLWVVGDGLEATAEPGGDRVALLRDGSTIDAADRSAAASSSAGTAAFHGIDRAPLFDGDRRREPAFSVRFEPDDGGDGSVAVAYAMPYFGRGNLVTPERIASLVEADPGGIRNFSLGPVDVE
ncbi:hypothetical protein [Halalkalicoccus salilacus]|uniref:hypothetical protein n=1 Tax=Halalkalicoccus salilacus TaxID=3117459 RepID=UPI00300EF7DB